MKYIVAINGKSQIIFETSLTCGKKNDTMYHDSYLTALAFELFVGCTVILSN